MGETKTPFQIIEDYLLDPMMYAGPERSLEALGALRAQLSASQAREREAVRTAKIQADHAGEVEKENLHLESELAAARKALENLRANFCAMSHQTPILESWIAIVDAALNGDSHAE